MRAATTLLQPVLYLIKSCYGYTGKFVITSSTNTRILTKLNHYSARHTTKAIRQDTAIA